MLELLASEEHPWAKQNVRWVGVDHREQQEVELEPEWSKVDHHAAHGIPRIPRLQHEPRNLNRHRLVCLTIPHQFRTVPEERNRCPENRCGDGCGHHQHEKFSHFCQRNLMISVETAETAEANQKRKPHLTNFHSFFWLIIFLPRIRFRKQRMAVRLIPDAHRAIDFVCVERHVDEFCEAVDEKQRRDGIGCAMEKFLFVKAAHQIHHN